MSEEKNPLHSETFFLPPLNMILSFFDKESRQGVSKEKVSEEQTESNEKMVAKLIEKLSEKDE
jgi:hypothetical protein